VRTVQGFGYRSEAVFAPGFALRGAGLGDEDGDGFGLVDSLLAEELVRGVDVVFGWEDLGFDQRRVGLKLVEESGAVA
jgi:hypothetical protein